MSILAAQFVGPLIKRADTIPGRILLEYSFQFNFIVKGWGEITAGDQPSLFSSGQNQNEWKKGETQTDWSNKSHAMQINDHLDKMEHAEFCFCRKICTIIITSRTEFEASWRRSPPKHSKNEYIPVNFNVKMSNYV